MLPSRGFFKKNDCPFFEKGLCVRPHCHFRHRKKVVSENSSGLDSQEDLLLSESLADIPLVNSINSESFPVSTSSTSNNEIEHSGSRKDTTEDQPSDSLFAKLVNQSNPYERISRHIPCAYTPTPQIRSAQPKNKTVSVKNNVNSSIDIFTKTQTLITNNSSLNIKTDNEKLEPVQNESKEKKSKSEQTQSINSQNNVLECDYKTSLFGEKLSYEPVYTTKSTGSESDQMGTVNDCSSYVPSKVTTAESKYVPNNEDLSLSNEYVPSKDKAKQSPYVPESSGAIKVQATYKPSDKTSGETQYQPVVSSFAAEYVPTDKSSIKTGTSWLSGEVKNELTEFEFISSEIEMMKELLKDEVNSKNLDRKKTDFHEKNENQRKEEKSLKEKEKDSKSYRSSSSRHKHKSRHSSKSKHSSSSSHHRSSSSSKHRSSSKSHGSSESRSRSKSHSSSHKLSSRHHKSHKSKEKSKSENDKEKKEKKSSETKKSNEPQSVSSEDDGNDALGDVGSEEENSSEKEGDSGTESENGSKKRKKSWDCEERALKLLRKTEEELFEELEEDPATVEKECLEIFNSYSSVDLNDFKKPNEILMSPEEEYESTIQGKKRTAHASNLTSDHSVLRHKTARKANNIKSAQEVMLERYAAIEKQKEKAKESQATPIPVQPAPILGLGRPSIRIAAVSNIQQMLQAKKAIQDKINQGLRVNERTTIAQTVSRGGSRVAHTPASKEMVERPTVSGGTKQVPQVKRQIYLDKLLLETNQIYPTKCESAEEALRLEGEVFRAHSGSSAAYHAAFISMLMKTRRRVSVVKGETSRANLPRPTVSHYDVLSGGKKNFSVIKTKKVDISMLSDRHIYEELLRCKLTPEELKENGYPVEGSKPGYATCAFNFDLKYNDKYLHIKKLQGNRRYCIRCSKQYLVHPVTLKQFKEGPETCCYHPGKKKSGGRNCDRIYNCCNSSSTEGCTTHVRHVTDCNDYENLPNCVKTLSKEDETNPGVFALDCEMVYTRLGYELARVTVVNLKKEVVYDTLVKPKYPIECYNTFYSGIEEKMMEGVETTLKDVQAVLLNMFSDQTILIGHSLDSDLRALHLIHETVVDTAIVYKNEKFHPYKYSLKDLCAKKISKIIQDNVGGHDSAEDAIAALEIMLNHVKEEVSKYDSLESYEADRGK